MEAVRINEICIKFYLLGGCGFLLLSYKMAVNTIAPYLDETLFITKAGINA
jgi:hypothetical protein